MIFFLDADFKDRTKIIETTDWEVAPIIPEDSGDIIGYELNIKGKHAYDLTEDSYKRIQNAFRGNTEVKKVFLCRNTTATFEKGL